MNQEPTPTQEEIHAAGLAVTTLGLTRASHRAMLRVGTGTTMMYAIFHETAYEGGWLEWFDTADLLRDRLDQLREAGSSVDDFRVLEVAREMDYADVIARLDRDLGG